MTLLTIYCCFYYVLALIGFISLALGYEPEAKDSGKNALVAFVMSTPVLYAQYLGFIALGLPIPLFFVLVATSIAYLLWTTTNSGSREKRTYIDLLYVYIVFKGLGF